MSSAEPDRRVDLSDYAEEDLGCLFEAAKIVSGARQWDYGTPKLNHGATANLWSIYLERKYGHALELDPRDVCMMNILQKIARDAGGRPTQDNLVDICGYARNAELCEDNEVANDSRTESN